MTESKPETVLVELKSTSKVLFFSVVRTLVPVIVGYVLGWLALGNVDTDALRMPLEAVLQAVFTLIYYVGARLLELHVSPKLGWLLGVPAQPSAYIKEARG